MKRRTAGLVGLASLYFLAVAPAVSLAPNVGVRCGLGTARQAIDAPNARP